MPHISTHVLDIAKGAPAPGITVELRTLGYQAGSGETNSDGRTDAPLLNEDRILPGIYDLIFHVGDYLRAQHNIENPFYEEITICFSVSDPEGNYHVPLLLAPHGYTTYRGS
jgi:5-hydroxyisourate hydrolase